MKKILLLVVAVALFASCTQSVEGVDNSLGYTTLTVGMPTNRTELGEKVNGIYQIYWSEGDQIVVNGGVSTKSEIGDGRKSATFHFETSVLEPPYHLTYPYTEGSLCSEGRPTVTFKSAQEYVAKSFGVGNAPMCGYCEQGNASMSHLAGVLRFAVTGKTTLSTIEIIADEGVALSGEFDVDCQEKTITAIDGKTTNKIVYTANKELTAEATLFHITVPYGNLGKCQVVLTDNSGLKMNLKWTATNVDAGVVREFTPFAFKGGASFELQEMSSITDDLEVPAAPEPPTELDGVWGYIKYRDGSPAKGVSVSDGFSVVKTNYQGIYQFKKVDPRTYYIYYSIPSDAKVIVNDNGYHTFFKRYSSNTSRYDFTLEKIAKESEFSLFAIADTHGARTSYVQRVEKECPTGVADEAKKKAIPCYSVILGDVVCCAAATKFDEDGNELADVKFEEDRQKTYYMPLMREMFAPTNTGGVPTFYVMGNHDHERAHFDNASANYSDLENFNFYAQRAFEEMFAPADYSFNRGDVHIVCMRNSQWEQYCLDNNTSHGDYNYGDFTDEQVEWLRQDLANVPEDKMVIFCIHIPLRDGYAYQGNKDVVELLKQRSKVKILSGHRHFNFSTTTDYIPSKQTQQWPGIDEVTITGNWGYVHSKCGTDGAPFGFDVYDFSGPRVAKNYFRACSSTLGVEGEGYQMRAYLSDMLSGKDATSTAKTGWYGNFYATNTSTSKYMYVNIFNGNADWTVKLKIYNSSDTLVRTYDMSRMAGAESGTWGTNGSGTTTDPYRPTANTDTRDWWVAGGFANSKASSMLTKTSCRHMFKTNSYIGSSYVSRLENGTYTFEIEATDPYGTTHKCSKLFDANDIADYLIYKW